MPDKDDTIQILLKERKMMRTENKLIEGRLHRVILLFLSAIGGFLTLHMKGDPTVPNVRVTWVLFALTQAAFFLFILAVSYWACLTVYIGYIKALEKKINLLSNEPLVIWEMKLAHRFTATWRGAFFWAWTILDVSFVLILLGLMVFFLFFHWNPAICLFFALEAIVSIGLFIWAMLGMKISERYALKEMGIPILPP